MRVIIAAGIYPPDIGGPATYARRLAEHLFLGKHKVIVITFSDYTQQGSENYEVVRIKRTKSKLISHFQYLYKLVKLAKYSDLVYAQGPIAGGWQSLIASIISKVPYLVKVTGDYAWEQGVLRYGIKESIDDFQDKKQSLSLNVKILRYVQSVVVRKAKQVIVPSRYLQEMVVGWGVARDKISVIYNAIKFEEAPEKIKKKRDDNKQKVLTVGRLVPWKGIDTLIKVWPEVLKQNPRAKLIIAGSGPQENYLQGIIDKLGLENNVEMIGRQTSKQMKEWYINSDMLILNSSYEGLPHLLLEAQSYGLPCAAANVGGNSEVIEDKINGLLFTHNVPAEIIKAISFILQNEKLAVDFEKAAKISLKKFDFEKMLKLTEDELLKISD